MIKRVGFIVLCTVCVLLGACKNDTITTGQSLLEAEDEIIVMSDTFPIVSGLRTAPRVVSLPDSFLIGELQTPYGTVQASVLTQLSCPVGFQYPENAVIDSVCMFLYYNSWVGDGHSPLALSVYEIDKQALEYTPAEPYYTDLEETDFCSFADSTNTLERQRIVLASVKTDSTYSNADQQYVSVVKFKFNDDFAKRFTRIRSFASQEQFDQLFKGLLIKSDFGSSTILNATTISVNVYYSFSYRKADATADTTVHDTKGFYANSEVRQVNLFHYPDGTDHLATQLSNPDTCYVVAPAGIYTKLKFPMGHMENTIKTRLGAKMRPYVNLAELRVEVFPNQSKGYDAWLKPSNRMLLIKDTEEGQIERFFAKHNLPDDTLAILGTLTQGVDSTGEDIYYYTYDLSALLTRQLRQENNPDTLVMTMVPVEAELSTSNGTSYVSAVKQSLVPSATKLRSAQHSTAPTRLKVVYSGFGY